MKRSSVDQLARTLAGGGSRRWALRTLAAGTLGIGLMARTTRSSSAQDDELFQQCLRSCLAYCTPAGSCPALDNCAASCSQAFF